MAFWSSETLRKRIPNEELVAPYNSEQVDHAAYELLLGPEAFITSTASKTKATLKAGEPLVIPPGQFALLMTEEIIRVPGNALALISIKFSIKARGLVNVSGFHVDPGFAGRLKFAVYNAGSREITITRGDRVFLIWYAELDKRTEDRYDGDHNGQEFITSEDQNRMHGEVASPAQLREDIRRLDHQYENNKWLLRFLAALLFGILVRLMFMAFVTPDSIKDEVRRDLLEELREEQRLEDAREPR